MVSFWNCALLKLDAFKIILAKNVYILWHGHLYFHLDDMFGFSCHKVWVTTKQYPFLDI